MCLVRFYQFPDGYESSPTFVLGMIVTLIGFGTAYVSDRHLLQLKQMGHGGYQIPTYGLFGYVSSAHFLGEILEWCGFCIANGGSLASVSFCIWTAANLVPRALAQHEWYHTKFPEEYPSLQRKAIIPFLV